MAVCRYELARRGSCRRGASCYFSHDLGFAPAESGRATTNLAASAPFFTPGLANFGPLAADLPQVEHNRRDNRALKPCTFYQRGICTKGTSCPYSHFDVNHEAGSTTRLLFNTDQDDVVDRNEDEETLPLQEITRSIDGLSVVFRAGAAVANVSLPQDFSTVSLTGLAQQTSKHAVLNLLEFLKVDISEATVKLTATDVGTTALVTAKDPNFANYMYMALSPDSAESLGYRDVKVQKVPTSVISGAGTQRINCRTVVCSWHKPTVTVYIRFGEQRAAERVCTKFSNGQYQIGDEKVQGRLQSPQPTVRGGRLVRHQTWTVILSNVLPQVTSANVEHLLIEDNESPNAINLSAPSYTNAVEHILSVLQQKLSKIGPLEGLTCKISARGKRHKAKAVFRDENDAQTACEILNETSLIGTVKLFLELDATAKIKVLTTIYDAVGPALGELEHKHSKVHFKPFRNTDLAQRFTVLKLFGSNSADLSSAKGEVDTLLEGYIANVSGRNVWHSSFGGPGGAQILKDMETKTSVLIVREAASSILRLFGPLPLCVHASEALADLVGSLTNKAPEIVLDERSFGIVISGVYRRIQSLLGADNVSLDISSQPKKLVIRGTEQDSKLASQILTQWTGGQAQQAEDDCPICWTTAERPITTHCGHIYCADCFENMCAAAGSAQEDCEIACQGAAGACKEILNLNDLQDNVTSSAFEAVLKTSLNTYIRLRPNEFSSCPSTDCGQIYRLPNTDSSVSKPNSASTHLCLKCLNSICLSCHACHGRITCADYKHISSGEAAAVEKLKKELGIKDCPRCKTAMEKTEGCNHMQCKGCGIHICWVCLRTFCESGSTYKHMTETHGGIGLDHLLAF